MIYAGERQLDLGLPLALLPYVLLRGLVNRVKRAFSEKGALEREPET